MWRSAPSRPAPKRDQVTCSVSSSDRISTRRSGESPITSPPPGGMTVTRGVYVARHGPGSRGHPRGGGELGAVARRRRLGALRHGVARGRPHERDLVPGPGGGLHRGQPRGVRARREHPALPGRDVRGRARRARDRPDEDDDPAARGGRRRGGRRRLHRALLRLLRAPRRRLGDRPPAADLREGPPAGARPGRSAHARPPAARALPGGLPAPRLRADEARVRRQARAARADRRGGRRALRGGARVAGLIRSAHTGQLDAATLAAARALLEDAFDGELTAEDWEHCLGGMHALAWEDGELVGHAALVQRRLFYEGEALRTGYVEGVGVRADRRRRGHGMALMAALEDMIRRAYRLGALGATDAGAAMYAARGWRVWEGPTSVLTPDGIVRTADEDGYIWVLDVTGALDRTRGLTCDWRDGDAW